MPRGPLLMFQLMYGMPLSEWESKSRPRPMELEDWMIPSDDGCLSSSSEEAQKDEEESTGNAECGWSGWRSGEAERDSVKSLGRWHDGTPIGKGHGSPYLAPRWAKQMHGGWKVVEGRPDEGVSTIELRPLTRRCRPAHHPPLPSPATSLRSGQARSLGTTT